jgi:hypothetical protein
MTALLLSIAQAAVADALPSSSPPASVAALPALDSGKARIVIIRESSAAEMLANARLYIADTKIGAISNGSAMVFDYPAGPVELKFDNPLTIFGGDLKFPLQLEVGQTYYVLIGGTIGRLGAIGAIDLNERRKTNTCSTDWCAREIDSSEAATLLQTYTLTQAGK